MVIFKHEGKLEWGALDVPVFGLQADWYGEPVEPPAGFAVVEDCERLWFLAHHRRAASLHPRSRPGVFLSELWKHDVAELFLHDPASGRYLELNLAPNAAWWSCEFTAPRVRATADEVAMPEVETFAELAPDGSWLAAMSVPLDLLRARVGYGENTRANVAMIFFSPEQRFLSAAKLGGEEPDFHRPADFPAVEFAALPEAQS